MKHKLESRLSGKKVNNLRYVDDTTSGRKWRGTKEPLAEVKEEREKAGLKLIIQKTKIMASGPITSWQINGETMETDTLFSWAPESLQMVTAAMKLDKKLWPT